MQGGTYKPHAAGWDSTPPVLSSNVSDGLKAAIPFSIIMLTTVGGRAKQRKEKREKTLPKEYKNNTDFERFLTPY